LGSSDLQQMQGSVSLQPGCRHMALIIKFSGTDAVLFCFFRVFNNSKPGRRCVRAVRRQAPEGGEEFDGISLEDGVLLHGALQLCQHLRGHISKAKRAW
jgi:hypothetical protein